MPDEIPSGEIVGDSAIDATASATDTNSQKEPAGNPWEAILNGSQADSKNDTEDATDDLDKSLLEADETDADDKIPAEGEDGEDKPDESEKSDEEKKKSRSQNYKDLQADKAALEAKLLERDTADSETKAKLDRLDTALEAYGGADQVDSLVENQNKFIDPSRYKEAVDYISTLPQAAAVYGEMLNRSFDIGDVNLDAKQQATAHANRVEVVNGALAKDFGLTEKLTSEEMSKTFEWLAARANKNKSELLDDISDELELIAPDDPNKKANEETNRRIAELEKQVADKTGDDAAKESAEEAPLDPAKINQILNDYESGIIADVSAEVLKDYATTLDKLSPIKANAIKALVRQELGAGKVFINLADYLITNKDHPNGKYLATQYRNSVKTLMRSVAVEFLGKPKSSTAAAAMPSATAQKSQTTEIKGREKGSINPAASAKEKANVWGEILNR